MTHVHHFAGARVGAALLGMLALLSPRAASAADVPLRLDSARVTLSGTSNVHPYAASTETVRVTRVNVVPAVVADDTDALLAPGAIEALEIVIPAASLTSPREGLDKNMHKALKTETYADITFALSRLTRTNAADTFAAVGTLTIAGVAREVALNLTIRKIGTALAIKGSLALLMTDYGIIPPKAMLGMLKTDPKVTIDFETVFSIRTT